MHNILCVNAKAPLYKESRSHSWQQTYQQQKSQYILKESKFLAPVSCFLNWLKGVYELFGRLPTISEPEILARVILARMFHHENILARATFGPVDVLADTRLYMRTFWRGDFSAQDILAPCRAIWTFWYKHFGTCTTVPKCPCTKMSPCRNVPVRKNPRAKNSSCQKFLAPKSPHVETFPCWNVYPPEPERRTVHVLKCSCD